MEINFDLESELLKNLFDATLAIFSFVGSTPWSDSKASAKAIAVSSCD